VARRVFVALISLAVASLFAIRLDAADLAYVPKWPAVQQVAPLPSPFVFEGGVRYWYSSGNIRWGFANNAPLFGNPTSTIDWFGYTSHSAEAFARLDHVPTGLFVKGMIGLGTTRTGSMDDRDFVINQFSFSDTSSKIGSGNPLGFASFDVGVTYQPYADLRVGAFVGYQYWREKLTAYGLQCNQSDIVFGACQTPGGVPIPFNVAVMSYEPTWHALRVGVEGRLIVDGNWSVSGEVAAIPYAALENKDSHLLRQSSADLGTAPNIITRSSWGYGVAAEIFINYAITANLEVGAGARYWGLFATGGVVNFGPTFDQNFPLNRFEQQRFGILLELKGRL
jgi:outer membrane protease